MTTVRKKKTAPEKSKSHFANENRKLKDDLQKRDEEIARLRVELAKADPLDASHIRYLEHEEKIANLEAENQRLHEWARWQKCRADKAESQLRARERETAELKGALPFTSSWVQGIGQVMVFVEAGTFAVTPQTYHNLDCDVLDVDPAIGRTTKPCNCRAKNKI